MSKSNEPTAEGPTAPTDKMAKAREAKKEKQDEIASLKAAVAELSARVSAGVAPSEAVVPEPPAARPGEYYVGGTDGATGKPVIRKRRWTRPDIERLYPKTTFVPVLTTPVAPHGVKPVYQLTAGEIATVPSIVKDIHDQMVLAIRRQSEGYKVSDEQSRAVFDAAKNDPLKGRYFEGLKHVGYGWPAEALQAATKSLKGDALVKEMEAIGWEPEVGFPGGFGGKPLPENK